MLKYLDYLWVLYLIILVIFVFVKLDVGIVKIVISLTKALKPALLIKSFETCGINTNCTIDIQQILTQFNQPLDEQQIYCISTKLDYGIQKFHENGTITDADISNFLMHNVLRPTDRDKKIISQQRCVIMTHQSTKKIEEARLLAKKKIAEENIAKKAAAIVERQLKAKAEADIREQKKQELMLAKEAKKLELQHKKKESQKRLELSQQTQIKELKRKLELAKQELAMQTTKKVKQTLTYCICNIDREKYHEIKSNMVKCANSKCSYEWFHYSCLNVSEDHIFSKIWHCNACKRTKTTLTHG